LQQWIDDTGISRRSSLLIGMSMDDPDITPLPECRYDFCTTVSATTKRSPGISMGSIPAARWASIRVNGDLQDVDDAWTYLFRDWLPSSGWQAAPLPAMEIFRQRPEEIGWDRFDLECWLPVTPLIQG
jgi:DNA gyrase inhibitor GyrI